MLNSPSSRCTTRRSHLPPTLHHPAGDPTAPPVVPKTPRAASSPTPSAPATSSPRPTPRLPACLTAPSWDTQCPVWSTGPSATAATLGRTARLRRTFPPHRAACRALVHRGRRAAGLGQSRFTLLANFRTNYRPFVLRPVIQATSIILSLTSFILLDLQ